MAVQRITDKGAFDAALAKAGSSLVAVDFTATWCGPCRQISPKFEEHSKSYTNVVFISVDVDEGSELAEKYGISCMPTFIFIKNKEKVDDFSGASVDKLKAMLEKHQ